MSNNIFRSSRSRFQYMRQREQEKLIRDYIRARDNYHEAVAESRRAYEELVRRGWISGDDEKSEK